MSYVSDLQKSIAKHRQNVETIMNKANRRLDANDLMTLLLERRYFQHISSLEKNLDGADFATCQLIDQRLRQLYQRMNGDGLEAAMAAIDLIHVRDFFEGFVLYEGYLALSDQELKTLLDARVVTLRQLLAYPELVAYYDEMLATYCTRHMRELLDIMMDREAYALPSALTSVRLNDSLLSYLRRHHIKEREAAYLSKLVTVKERLIYNDVRLIASYKLLDSLRAALPEGYLLGQEITYDFKVQKEERLTMIKDDHLEVSYSLRYITAHMDEASLMNHFLYLFDFCDYQGRLKSGRVYHTIHQYKEHLNATLHGFADEMFDDYLTGRIRQLQAYDQLLLQYNSSLNHLVTWFFNIYLPHFFKQGQLVYHVSGASHDQTYGLFKHLQKVMHVFAQERTLIKTDRKYAYGNDANEHYQRIVYLLFDEQALINKTHYTSFYDALLHHAIVLDKYHEIEMSYISYLINHKMIVYHQGTLSITEEAKAMKELYQEGVIVRMRDHYSRQCLQSLERDHLLRYGDAFLSEDELNACTYIMKKALTDANDDWMLMLLMIEWMIKINDELSHNSGGVR